MSAGKSQLFYRLLFYGIGLLLTATGLSIISKVELGLSPTLTLPYVFSVLLNCTFPSMVFVLYIIFVIIQLFLNRDQKRFPIFLQVPFSFVFSFLLSVFEDILVISSDNWGIRIALLIFAITITAIGAAMMVNMQLISNPADGLSDAVGRIFKKDQGFGKNLLDAISVALSVLIGFIFFRAPVGIGIGTIILMLLFGRVITIFNYFCKTKQEHLAGLQSR